jgi:alkanesulfonate monooxygenase SsuD/methylene tetrahydromethanopterin reductase-like flavin-dependent oxidoreductase (luciferase family)
VTSDAPANPPPRFGVMLDHQYEPGDDLGRRIGELVELVELCRDLGYDGVFGIHHYLANLTTLQPLTLLARLIDRSGEMQLGTAILIGSLVHPVHVAEELATLDQLSGGRLVFGVGSGYRDDEFDAFGVDRTHRTARLHEAIALIRLLWSGEKVTFQGAHFQLDGQRASVIPAQAQPPIWVAGNSPGGIRRAARMGLPWLAPANVKRNWAVGNLGDYFNELEAAGFDRHGLDCPINRNLSIADDTDAAYALVGDEIRASYAAYAGYNLEYFETQFDDIARKAFFFGGAAQLVEKIDDFSAAGFNYFVMRTKWLGLTHETTLGLVERFAREVISHYRGGQRTVSSSSAGHA